MVVFAALLAACGSEATIDSAADTAAAAQELPVVVATTNILGDVLTNIAGDHLDVVTIMPIGSDPHDFQPSAKQVAEISEASAIIANGAAFEEGLLDIIEASEADGVPVFEAISAVNAVELGAGGHDDHDEDGHDDHDEEAKDHDDEDHDDHDDEDHDEETHDDHGDEDHDDHDEETHDDHDEDGHDDHAHEAGSTDPHFFTDPARMAVAASGIVEFLIENVSGVDADALRADADEYVATLEALDEEVETILAAVPNAQRVLVTNHEVFGYFADRYGFEVIGAVVPNGSTTDGVSGQRLAELADVLRSEGVTAVFADTSSSDELAQALADEVGDVSVVALFSESLGAADSAGATYVDMVRDNAEQIAEALGS